ncbi:MAG: hypothetical protein HYR48_05290 [Gemmatimonadetes bacterium]|nr:hypothetical protein [Gemmatimonadota bacterium]
MTSTSRAPIAFAVVVTLAAPAALAQARFDFYARGPYRAEVPRPSALLGYEPGEFHTNYGNMERVIHAIAASAPDRVRIFEIGRSEERRTLYLIAVSSPENIRRLGEIKAQTARLADPRATSPADAQAIIAGLPATVWLNYANDGNETAAFEAAMQVLYQLAASGEPATLEVLRNAVVLINPAHNPESHERFVAWYNAFGTGVADHAALEHDAPWGMSTNNNHYQIDLNRDALALTQRETRAIVRAFLDWHPQVFVDHHGQTTQFFFPPAALPVNQNIPPQTNRWMEAFGRGNAAAFDRYGWQYYVRDVFDLFYAGYWDSWPALNGATGMTYETDGGGDLGLNWHRDDGSIVTFRDGIAKHFTASLATAETAAQSRVERLRDYYDFRRTGMEETRREPMKRVVLVPGTDPRRAAELVEILLRDGIEVSRTTAPFTSLLAHDYLGGGFGGRAARQTFPAGVYVVDLAQPQKRLAKAILEPAPSLDADFVREQLARRARNARRGEKADREGDQFYDVTAWSLPYTFGVEAYWTEDTVAVNRQPLALGDGEDVAVGLAPVGGASGRARSAYVFPNDRNGAGALAMALLTGGYRVAAATRPLRADGRNFPRGTFVVRVERNPESLHDSIGPWGRRFGVDVTVVQSAYADSGTVGIGGEDVVSIRAPRILVGAGEGVSDTEYGALWYFLERVLQVPFTPVRVSALDSMRNLDDYNVLIFPNGSPGRYDDELGTDGVSRLKAWIEHGGVFIGWKGGARFAMRSKVDWTSVRIVGSDEDSSVGDSGAVRDTTLAADQRPGPPLVAATAPKGTEPLDVPGSIFRATLDRSHWLTFGYEHDQLPVMMSGSNFFRPSRAGANPVAFAGDSLLISGFVWPNNTERLLRNTAWAAVENVGRGHVVLFADSPVYRLFWRSTYRLLENAMLFGTGR